MAKTQQSKHKQFLMELTNLPTAAGYEQNVVQYIESFVARRENASLKKDRYGNLYITAEHAPRKPRPLIITAHLDHPAFVALEQTSATEVAAEFRGGVADGYFVGSKVRLHRLADKPVSGTVVKFIATAKSYPHKKVVIRFSGKVEVVAGQIITWQLPKSRISGSRLRAPVCDDLAAVAGALAAFDIIIRKRKLNFDVRLLFTRAEEVGFLGAIAAAKHKLIPAKARLITLENSKSFVHDSPIGGGPILRVGDRMSTFDNGLNVELDRIAIELAKRDKTFKYQRKLMPGGACEATAFQAYGYLATCLCLPLGNYHNMNEQKKCIDSEIISTDDYDNLIKWLVAIAENMDKQGGVVPLKARLSKLLSQRSDILMQ